MYTYNTTYYTTTSVDTEALGAAMGGGSFGLRVDSDGDYDRCELEDFYQGR